ncbi:MAG: DUF460 domain-containing protein [Candidatus Aenigmarchaeota archaeon]|nr:DUF460 domain-containing protein [Candidatus Aenigmarchaeota archaeon]
MRPQLIVGVDPGTTTGISILDLDGRVISVMSGKGLSRSDISGMISQAGNPVIIASDINPVPRALEKLASAFLARIVTPTENFTREDKLDMAKAYTKKYYERRPLWNNKHERDSLVAAIYAWKRVRPLMRKIDERLEDADTEASSFVKGNVIMSRTSIDASVKQFYGRRH